MGSNTQWSEYREFEAEPGATIASWYEAGLGVGMSSGWRAALRISDVVHAESNLMQDRTSAIAMVEAELHIMREEGLRDLPKGPSEE